jgi:exopolyphosphatase/guanosine-5'-triphosphate,3'-diphosphate pyrophosphatase
VRRGFAVTRVAAIDCGTNSIRLLIADVTGPTLTDVTRQMEIVRLGEGVDRTGRINETALARTLGALARYQEDIVRTEVAGVRMVATSATRDAANRADFVSGVREILGVEPEVVTGEQEAALSFAGATREIQHLPRPHLVVDIGGGSTEFVLGDERGVLASCSVNIGCVRLTERHLTADPPTAEQIAAAESDVAAALDDAARSVPLDAAATLIGVAGTVTTIAAIAAGLPDYDPERIHLSHISGVDVDAIAERLLTMRRVERAALPVMHPGRVDVIGAGALILRAIAHRAMAAEVVASEHDILDGIAYSVAEGLG